MRPTTRIDKRNIINLVLSPNPTSNIIQVSFTPSESKQSIMIFDVNGREIFFKTYSEDNVFNKSLDLKRYASGVYFIRINDGSYSSTKKIIKQ